jgi:hypothetical protein
MRSVSPTVVGGVVFACTLGGALAGFWLRSALPGHHLEAETKDTVRLGIGLVATMTALVLGLVTASAKSSFDAMDSAVKQTASDLLALDRALARYGPETGEIRAAVKLALGRRLELTWPDGASRPAGVDPSESIHSAEVITDRIAALPPQTDAQQHLRSRALDLAEAAMTESWGSLVASGSSVPVVFLTILSFWLTVIFASFGLFAPRNATALAVLLVCALSVAGAVFLVLELDGAFEGVIRVSPDPLRLALEHLDR